MEFRLVLVFLVISPIWAAPQTQTPSIKYVDPEDWLREVHGARKHGENVLDLERYDPQLVRAYALHFQPPANKSGVQDLYWKLEALAAYGQLADVTEVRKTISALRQVHLYQPEVDADLHMYEFVIQARYNDSVALQRIRSAPPSRAMSLLRLCRSEALREKFVEIATDPNEDTGVRSTAVYTLARLGDPRSLEIALSDEFVAVMRAYGDIMKILAGMTGIEEINDAPTLEAARKLIKERGVRYPAAQERISVKGGIDWSKVKWETEDPLQSVRESIRLLPAADVKQCPYCGEKIRHAAPVCTFCGRELVE